MSPRGTNTVTLSDFHESVPGTRSTPSLARPSTPSPTIARTTALRSRTLPAVSTRRGYPARVALNREVALDTRPLPVARHSVGGPLLAVSSVRAGLAPEGQPVPRVVFHGEPSWPTVVLPAGSTISAPAAWSREWHSPSSGASSRGRGSASSMRLGPAHEAARLGSAARHDASANLAASSNDVSSKGTSVRSRSSRAIVGLFSPSISGRATEAPTGVTR